MRLEARHWLQPRTLAVRADFPDVAHAEVVPRYECRAVGRYRYAPDGDVLVRDLARQANKAGVSDDDCGLPAREYTCSHPGPRS